MNNNIFHMVKVAEQYSKEYDQIMEQLMESVPNPEDLLNVTSHLEIPYMPIPTIEIPEIDFPTIDIPPVEIDVDRIEQITNDNSKHGWTLTQEMNLVDYLKNDLIEASTEQKDQHFLSYYTKEEGMHYNAMKDTIMETIEPHWKDTLGDAFYCIENHRFKPIIPALFSIIEGELASLFQTHKMSGPIIDFLNEKASNETEEFEKIALYSLLHSLKKQVFTYDKFSEERHTLINRHRVLHGRDDPSHWTQTDAYRLLTVLSTIQFTKTTFE